MIRTLTRGVGALCLATLVGTWAATPALAQDQAPPLRDGASTSDAARRAFEEGRALFAAGRYAEACPKLEESQRLHPDVRTQFGLGDCYEKLGKLASAWRQFDHVARAADSAGNAEQHRFALDRARALLPRLARLTISVSGPSSSLEGFTVTRDGVRVDRSEWSQALPVDPGRHRIEATATGHRPWSRDVDASSEGALLLVEVPPLEPSVARSRPAPRRAAPPAPARRATPAPAETENAQRTIGIVTGAVGLATLGTGAVLGLLAKDRFSDSDAHCTNGKCDDEGLAIREDAHQRGNVATIVAIAGGALATGGVVLFLTAPGDRERPVGARAAFRLTASSARVSWQW